MTIAGLVEVLRLGLEIWGAFTLLCGALAMLLPAGRAHDVLQQVGSLAPRKFSTPVAKTRSAGVESPPGGEG